MSDDGRDHGITDAWGGRRVLVTGGAGFIGAHLVHALLERSAEVHVLDIDDGPGSPLSLLGSADAVHFAPGRLERFEDVTAAIEEAEVDTVFHLGAQTIVGVARRDPLATFDANVGGTTHVLEACRCAAAHVRRVVVASSDKAYGDCDTLPYEESTPLAGRFPYDVSKTCTDLLAQSYATTYGLPVAIARCGNVFGPADLHWSRLVPGTIRSLLRGERPVIRSDGTLVRDYLYVDDAVSGYLALADWLDAASHAPGAPVDPRAFNFSTGRPQSVLEMTERLRVACGRPDLEPVIEDTARGEIAAQHLDSTRAHTTLGWRPNPALDESLARTTAWYRANLDAIDDAARPEGTMTIAALHPGGAPE
jgi:CDP-glucose 4,6-dehydratase